MASINFVVPEHNLSHNREYLQRKYSIKAVDCSIVLNER